MCEVEFIELGFVMKLAAIWEDIQELLHWTATGELASFTADAVAGGCPDFEYDDLVAYERDSGVLYGRIFGSPDAPETYRVEFGHGICALWTGPPVSLCPCCPSSQSGGCLASHAPLIFGRAVQL